MNELEQWLNDVKAYNESAALVVEESRQFETAGFDLGIRGRRLGLKLAKIKSILAQVKLTVIMPEEQKP